MDRYLLANRYELIDKIGSGGMATVYRARCQTLDRMVAVKILKDELAADPSLVSRFKSEAMAAARLSHPNLVNIFDVGEDDGIHYIVMEYIEGHTLRDAIAEQGFLSPQQAVNIAVMVCDGLEHAHSRGLIHRDIKPHNILVTRDGKVKIADFGIARVVNTSTITYGSNVMGSVYYISPEQAKGEVVGPETDIYSLGCVLYEMLTGRPIFDGDSPITVALKHVHEDPVPPRTIRPEIPSGLERIILRAVAKDPAVRYHSANEMKEALIRYSDLPMTPRNKNQADDQTIPMTAAKKDKRKIFNKTNIIWVVVALLGLALGMLTTNRDLIFGKEVKVPDVTGMTQKDAFTTLTEKDLKMRVLKQVTSDKYDAGRIISQEPQSGETVKTGREVEVVVSKGGEMAEVPRLIGKDLGVATSLLEDAGLEVGDVERTYDEEETANTVLEQEPSGGKEVKSGSKVNLVVSKGKKPAGSQVPEVVGMYLSEAKGTLEAAGLVLGEISKEDSTKYFTGQVTMQEPKAGTEIEQGTQVNLTVSKGPGPEPERTTINYTLPPDQDYYQVRMVLKDAKGERDIYSGLNRANETIQVVVSYYGQGEVTVYLNSQPVKKYEI
ncbi:MAG: protein kinase domain-containing protein [Methanomassiliicoccales archaeon]